MWKKGEIVQLIAYPGGDLYFAKSVSYPAGNLSEHHIWTREFREMTAEERRQHGLPARVGAPIGDNDVSVSLVPEDIPGFRENEGAFAPESPRRRTRKA